jgi:hypothetical protein
MFPRELRDQGAILSFTFPSQALAIGKSSDPSSALPILSPFATCLFLDDDLMLAAAWLRLNLADG